MDGHRDSMKESAKGRFFENCESKYCSGLYAVVSFQEFVVKYLGKKEARGLWGIKHTRKPVDDMVGLAR